jgi:prephenate dehydrogenase
MERVAILGVGLIGGSLGLALKSLQGGPAVVGYDVHRESLALAKEFGAVDSWTTDLADAVKDADIVVLSTPVGIFQSMVKEMAPFLKPGAIVTDTGSTKEEIIRQLAPLIPDQVEFVGGHPMAGSEKSGIRAADRYLFENAVYVLTPTERNSTAGLAKVKAMAEAVGSRVLVMDPGEHDTIVAAVSHVPHLTAACLTLALKEVSGKFPLAPTLAAGGFRDTTRIAAGDPGLWQQICFSNRKKINRILDLLCEKLLAAKEFIQEDNSEGLLELLTDAREQRLKIPLGLRGVLPALYEIVITVPDKPGMIAYVSTLLGNNNVNIIDIEILRVREGQGGTIRLGFQNEYERDKAEKLFHENHVTVWRL